MTHIVIVIYCGTFKENMKQWKVTLHRMRTPLRDKHYRYRWVIPQNRLLMLYLWQHMYKHII